MKLRAFTLVLTLAVAAAPVISLICELDCDASSKAAAQGCHKPAGNVVSLRHGAHECRHQHGATEAAVTNSSARDFSVSLIAAFVPIGTIAVGATQSKPAVLHGPPGSRVRSSTSVNVVLRI